MTHVSIDAHARYFFATDIAVFVIGSAVLMALRLIPRIFSPLVLLLMIAGLGIGLGVDMLRWHLRGIRSIQLSDEELTLYRGTALAARRMLRREILSVRTVRRLGRRTAVVRLARGRVRISEDAFPREEFRRFLNSLSAWAGAPPG